MLSAMSFSGLQPHGSVKGQSRSGSVTKNKQGFWRVMRSSVQPPPEKSRATSQQRQGCLQRVFKHPSLRTILFLYSQRSNCQRLGGIYLHIPFPTNTKGYPPTPTKPSKYFKSLLFSINYYCFVTGSCYRLVLQDLLIFPSALQKVNHTFHSSSFENYF